MSKQERELQERRNEERRDDDRVVMAAAALLRKIDNMTTDQFSKGGERKEREALRAALDKAGVRVNVEA